MYYFCRHLQFSVIRVVVCFDVVIFRFSTYFNILSVLFDFLNFLPNFKEIIGFSTGLVVVSIFHLLFVSMLCQFFQLRFVVLCIFFPSRSTWNPPHALPHNEDKTLFDYIFNQVLLISIRNLVHY